MIRSDLPYRGADFTLSVDGVDFTAATRPRLVGLTVTEKRGGEADELDVTLSDHDGRLALPARGGIMTVALGWRTLADDGAARALVDKGRFHIDEVTWTGPPDQIQVKGRSADLTGGLRIRAERSWRDTTLGAVLRELASAYGLQPQIAPGLAGVPLPVLSQSRESDAALLRRLGRLYDAVATIKAGRLIFAPMAAGETAGGAALPALQIARGDVDQATYTLPQREDYTGVTATWHDTAAATRKTAHAGEGGENGAGRKRLPRTFGTEADAQSAADGEWGRTQRAAATLSLTLALGRPEIYPEQKPALTGFKPEIDASGWLVTQAVHTLNESGLTTALELEAAP